jgi:hypothetical protein
MRKYRLLKKKGEGTFSEVLAAQNIKTSELCAIKCEAASAGGGKGEGGGRAWTSAPSRVRPRAPRSQA